MLLALWTVSSAASTQLALGFEELVQESAAIFEGRVIASESRWDEAGEGLLTEVTFQVIERIKGAIDDRRITLRFAGGAADGLAMAVTGVEPPVIGERGIYFLAGNGYRRLHPLTGWAQGHFLLVGEEANARVLTEAAQPVLAVHATSKTGDLSRGVAQGLDLGMAKDVSRAVTAARFKAEIRRLIGARRAA